MPEYRFYVIGLSGSITQPGEVKNLDTDADAFMFAAHLTSEHVGAEAWQLARLVCRVPPKARDPTFLA